MIDNQEDTREYMFQNKILRTKMFAFIDMT